MLFRKEKKYYVALSDRELRLAKYALLQFRNKLLAEGKPTEDVNELLLKLWKQSAVPIPENCYRLPPYIKEKCYKSFDNSRE